MNQSLFYNVEKVIENKAFRLSISVNATYEEAIQACKEFVEQLTSDLAQKVATEAAAKDNSPEVITPEATPVESVTPEVVG